MTSAGASAGRPARNDGTSPIACSADSVTITPLPAARPSALSTAPVPPASSSRTKAIAASSSPAANARARAARTPAAAATSWQNALEVSSLRRLAVRPEDGDPRRPAAHRRRRPPAAPRARRRPARRRARAPARRPRAGSSGSTAATRTCGSPEIPALPGRDQHLVHARLAAQLPGERVLAAAAADDEDAGGHHERHRPVIAVRPSPPGGGASAATPARWSGSARDRPRRTRSAPPACASSADT